MIKLPGEGKSRSKLVQWLRSSRQWSPEHISNAIMEVLENSLHKIGCSQARKVTLPGWELSQPDNPKILALLANIKFSNLTSL